MHFSRINTIVYWFKFYKLVLIRVEIYNMSPSVQVITVSVRICDMILRLWALNSLVSTWPCLSAYRAKELLKLHSVCFSETSDYLKVSLNHVHIRQVHYNQAIVYCIWNMFIQLVAYLQLWSFFGFFLIPIDLVSFDFADQQTNGV